MTSQENQQSQSRSLSILPQSGDVQQSQSSLPALDAEWESEGQKALRQFTTDRPSYWTNLPVQTPEQVERVSVLLALNDTKSKACANQVLEIVGFAVSYGPVGSTEDGEIIEGLRGHIALADGKSVFTTSRGVLQGLATLRTVYGSGEYSPPVRFEIIEVKAKRGDALLGIPRGRVEKSKPKKA